MVLKDNHVKFARFMLLAVSGCVMRKLLDLVFVKKRLVPKEAKKSIEPRYFEQYFCASFLLSSVIFNSAFTFVKMNAHMIITTFSHDKINKTEHINFDLVI